jgi:hypothetical protein
MLLILRRGRGKWVFDSIRAVQDDITLDDRDPDLRYEILGDLKREANFRRWGWIPSRTRSF